MFIKYYSIALLVLIFSFNVCAESEGQALLDEQKEALEKSGIDMNQSGKLLYDTFSNSPQTVAESGCLNNLRGVSVDAIMIDPMNMLGAVYSALKDEIMTQACSGVTDFANTLNDDLNTKLELPYGIASLEIDDIAPAAGSEGVFKPNVKLDNEKVANNVAKSVLKSVRSKNYDSRSGIIKKPVKRISQNQQITDTSDVEKKLEDAIDIGKIWGGKKEGVEVEVEGGNND